MRTTKQLTMFDNTELGPRGKTPFEKFEEAHPQFYECLKSEAINLHLAGINVSIRTLTGLAALQLARKEGLANEPPIPGKIVKVYIKRLYRQVPSVAKAVTGYQGYRKVASA